MFRRIPMFMAAFGLAAAVFVAAPAPDADARTTKCWKCTGGWCCY